MAIIHSLYISSPNFEKTSDWQIKNNEKTEEISMSGGINMAGA